MKHLKITRFILLIISLCLFSVSGILLANQPCVLADTIYYVDNLTDLSEKYDELSVSGGKIIYNPTSNEAVSNLSLSLSKTQGEIIIENQNASSIVLGNGSNLSINNDNLTFKWQNAPLFSASGSSTVYFKRGNFELNDASLILLANNDNASFRDAINLSVTSFSSTTSQYGYLIKTLNADSIFTVRNLKATIYSEGSFTLFDFGSSYQNTAGLKLVNCNLFPYASSGSFCNMPSSRIEMDGGYISSFSQLDFQYVAKRFFFSPQDGGIPSINLEYGATISDLNTALERLGNISCEYSSLDGSVSDVTLNAIPPHWNLTAFTGFSTIPQGTYYLSSSIDQFNDGTRLIKNATNLKLDCVVVVKSVGGIESISLERVGQTSQYILSLPHLSNATSLYLSYRTDNGIWQDYTIEGEKYNILNQHDEYIKADGSVLVDTGFNYSNYLISIPEANKTFSLRFTVEGKDCLYLGTSNAFSFTVEGKDITGTEATPIVLPAQNFQPTAMIIVLTVMAVAAGILVFIIITYIRKQKINKG